MRRNSTAIAKRNEQRRIQALVQMEIITVMSKRRSQSFAEIVKQLKYPQELVQQVFNNMLRERLVYVSSEVRTSQRTYHNEFTLGSEGPFVIRRTIEKNKRDYSKKPQEETKPPVKSTWLSALGV